MKVRQAIVTSADAGDGATTSLLARTLKIDDQLAGKLCQWCPGRNDLDYGKTSATSFFKPAKDTFALARTTVSSMTGQREVQTQIVLLDSAQMAGFHNNAMLLSHYLRSEGTWMYPFGVKKGLPMLEIPDRALTNLYYPLDAEEVTRINQAIEVHPKVALLGVSEPQRFIGSFLQSKPPADRPQLSFSIGLRSSGHRPFAVQVFESSDLELSKELASAQIRTLSFESTESNS